jgi:CDP-6-deoxy-D-xylo-4-hexulose-3-dehydrase
MNTSASSSLDWPLMNNNITRADLDVLIEYLQQEQPRLTQGDQVRAFEREWSEWLGVRHSVFLNSGASANLLTMAALRHHFGEGEVIVPTLTWVSDISSVLQNGMRPVFVDIDPRTLGMDTAHVLRSITPRTRAVFLTHVLGYNALNRELVEALQKRGIPLIEDVCESHGATFEGRRLGSIGRMSNFSFYFAHHMSTIEGGMVSTNDEDLHQTVRMLRSHGMVREASSQEVRERYKRDFPDLNPDFIFAFPAYNVRSTELNAVLGRSQLKRLDANNRRRTENLEIFLKNLDPDHFYTDFATEGSSNYAFTLVLRRPNDALRDRIEAELRSHSVEFRRGTAGGGNQLRQPYLRGIVPDREWQKYPHVDHIHFYGYYIGNYPELDQTKIYELCSLVNQLAAAQA